MAKLETVMKEAIARGARRQLRAFVVPMRREVLRLRRKLTELQATVGTLRRSALGWDRLMKSSPPVPQVPEDQARAARLSPRLVKSLRRRLGLSQIGLARIVGVSAPAVAHWEGGKTAPKGQNRATLIGLRKVGRREAKALLEQRPAAAKPKKRRLTRRGRKRRGTRRARR